MPDERQLTPGEIEARVAKDRAETEAFYSDVRRNDAYAKKYLAEAAKLDAEAGVAQITLVKSQRIEREELALDKHHFTYVFDKEVGEASVKECIKQLTQWERLSPECHVDLVINSPGGGVFDGFALVDYITGMLDRGCVVDTHALGMAASMGGVLLQAGVKRTMGKSAMLLIHEAQFGAFGSFGHVEDQVTLVKIMHDQILTLFATRAMPINPKTTKAWIKAAWQRKDWWMSAAQAATLGFCDEVK